MHCVLIQPPLCDPSCPPLGLAYLSATLEEVGIEQAIFDLNLNFIDFIEELSLTWTNGILGADKCLGRLDSPLPVTTSRLPTTPEEYLATSERFKESFRKVSELFPETPIEPFRLLMHEEEGDLAKIVNMVRDPNGLYMHWLKRNNELEKIIAIEPIWIGLSVSYLSQLPAALAIAHQCKIRLRTTVIFGGGLFKDFETCLGPDTPVWDFIDGIVVGAGEKVLRSLTRKEDGSVLPTVGRRDLNNGKWIATAGLNLIPPRPNFRHFPLQRYRAAGLVLPYRVFSRCSWDKCVFCADSKYAAHVPSAGGNSQAVAEELTAIVTKYVAEGIYFLDAELPERFMTNLSRVLANTLKPPPLWGANARFSSGMADPRIAEELFRGGCRFLRFGLESASPRILSSMRKSVDPGIAEQVLGAIHSAGIATHVYLMKGFPGETPRDWELTTDFVIRNFKYIDMFNISMFQLYNGSPISSNFNNDVLSNSLPDLWVHPRLTSQTSSDDAHRELESEFFARKEYTRCFLTPADTIILADKMRISYSRKD